MILVGDYKCRENPPKMGGRGGGGDKWAGGGGRGSGRNRGAGGNRWAGGNRGVGGNKGAEGTGGGNAARETRELNQFVLICTSQLLQEKASV